MPTRAHPNDAGFDLYARESKNVRANDNSCFDTGVHIRIPEGFVGMIKSKSGLNVKYDITTTGVIDAGYTGSICVKLYNNGKLDYIVQKGDKIAQLVIMPIAEVDGFYEVDNLGESARGNNGFGSSGR